MKKITKLLLATIVLLFVWIGIDRFTNIVQHQSEDSLSIIQVSDSVWTNIPTGKWIQIDSKNFNALDSFLYVEDFNPITRTWKNVLGTDTTYSYKDERSIYRTISIFERSIDFDHEFELDNESLQSETVNGVDVSYGDDNNSYVIKFENEECEIIIITDKDTLNLLKPTLQEILNQLQ